MKFLVVVASAVTVILARPEYYAGGQYPYQGPLAPIGHDGRVTETPEVAQAKAKHLQAFANIAARISHAGPSDDYEGNDYGQANTYSHPYAAASYGYSSPTQFSTSIYHVPQYQASPAPFNHKTLHHAGNLVAYNSYFHETPEKFAYGMIPARHNYAVPIYGHEYHGPLAPLAHDGRVMETEEVQAAKAAHFAAIAKATHGLYGHYGIY